MLQFFIAKKSNIVVKKKSSHINADDADMLFFLVKYCDLRSYISIATCKHYKAVLNFMQSKFVGNL